MKDRELYQLAQANSLINELHVEVDNTIKSLNHSCTFDGLFSFEKLDDHQQISYDLAFCVAEIEATKAFLNYAKKVNDEFSFTHKISLASCAENLNKIWHRLFTHHSETNLSRDRLLKFMQNQNTINFLNKHGSTENLANLGKVILENGMLELPSGLGEEKDIIRTTFARFTDKIVVPVAESIHRNSLDIPDQLIDAAAKLGCFGVGIPEAFGGAVPEKQKDSIGMLVVTEELSRGSLGAAGSLITRPEIAARALLSGGTEKQKKYYLPRLASGALLSAIAITEPNYGSDVASLSLSATKIGNGWILNGAKTWCTFAGKADILVLIARTNKDEKKPHRGLSMFFVKKPQFSGHSFNHKNPSGGCLIGKSIPTIGYRGMHSFDLSFEDYFIPSEALIGEERGQGKGFYLAMEGLTGGRIQTAARASGVMEASIRKAIAYANDRRVFSKTLASYQLTQIKIARMAMDLSSTRQFSYSVARLIDKGVGKMESSLVKLYSCQAAERVTREAMQIHGGMGYAEESDVSRYFVDARVLSIFEGAEETLALKVIARELISKAST